LSAATFPRTLFAGTAVGPGPAFAVRAPTGRTALALPPALLAGTVMATEITVCAGATARAPDFLIFRLLLAFLIGCGRHIQRLGARVGDRRHSCRDRLGL